MAKGSKRGIEAGRAYVKAFWDDSAITRGLKRMRTGIRNAGAAIGKAGFGLLGAASAMGAMFIKPIRDAGEMEAVFASFDTIFKDQAKSVGEWGDRLAEEIGRSKTEMREFLTGTQARFVAIPGIDPRQAAEMSKTLTELAFDLAAFYDKDDATGMQALQNAMTGEMEMLKQFGVVISAADTDARLKAMGLDPRTATQAKKTQARFQLVQERTAAVQGTALREAGEYGSMMKRVSAEVRSASEAIGVALLPTVIKVMEHMATAARRAAEFAKANTGLIVGVAAAVPVVGALGAALAVLGTTMVWLAAVMGVVFSPAGVLIGGLALATAAVLKFTNTGKVIAAAFQGVFDPLLDALKTVQAAIEAGDIEGAARVMFASLKVIWAQGTTDLKKIWSGAISWMSKMLVDATSGWGTLWAHMMMDFANMTGDQEMWQRWSDVHLQRGQAILDTKGTIDAMAAADIARYQAELDAAKTALEKEVQAQDKKNAEAARGPAVEAPRPGGSSGGAADIPGMPEMPTLPQIDSRVKEAVAGAVNTATVANTSQAADALGKALGMGMGITDGDKMLGTKLDQINKSVKGLDGGSEGVI